MPPPAMNISSKGMSSLSMLAAIFGETGWECNVPGPQVGLHSERLRRCVQPSPVSGVERRGQSLLSRRVRGASTVKSAAERVDAALAYQPPDRYPSRYLARAASRHLRATARRQNDIEASAVVEGRMGRQFGNSASNSGECGGGKCRLSQNAFQSFRSAVPGLYRLFLCNLVW